MGEVKVLSHVLWDFISRHPSDGEKPRIIIDEASMFKFSLRGKEYTIEKRNGFYLVEDYKWVAEGLNSILDGRINVYNSINYEDKEGPFFLNINPVSGRRLDVTAVCETIGEESRYKARNGWGDEKGIPSKRIITACSLEHALYKLNDYAKRINDSKWSIYKLTTPGNLGVFRDNPKDEDLIELTKKLGF